MAMDKYKNVANIYVEFHPVIQLQGLYLKY